MVGYFQLQTVECRTKLRVRFDEPVVAHSCRAELFHQVLYRLYRENIRLNIFGDRSQRGLHKTGVMCCNILIFVVILAATSLGVFVLGCSNRRK